MSVMATYTYLLALARVEHLKVLGIWPAIIGPDARGRFRLSYDPEPVEFLRMVKG